MACSSQRCDRLLWKFLAFCGAHVLLANSSFKLVEAFTHARPLKVITWSIGKPAVYRTSAASLSAAAAEKALAGEEEKEPTKNEAVEDPKERLTRKYRQHARLSAILSAFLLGMPDRTNPTTLATKAGGAAGYGVAAGVSGILASAAQKGILSSDTYKRLNVGLLLFSALSLLATPGEASLFPNLPGALCTALFMLVVRLLGVGVAYEGWLRGIGPGTDDTESKSSPSESSPSRATVLQEFLDGTGETIRDSLQGTKKSIKYRATFFLLVFGGLGNNLMSLQHSVRCQGTAFQSSLYTSGVARLTLLSTIVYTLKSAAERDRLSGTTFIRLNFLMAAWSLAVGIGDGMTRAGFSPRRAVNMLLFALPFLSIGVQSWREKQNKT